MLIPGLGSVSATLLGAATPASDTTGRFWRHKTFLGAAPAVPGTSGGSCNAPGRSSCCLQGHRTQLLLLKPQNAPATFQDVASAACGATRRSCNAARRCKCCFWTLQLLLLEPERSCRHRTLLGAISAAAGATRGSCNAPGRCKCCFYNSSCNGSCFRVSATLLRCSWAPQVSLQPHS